jgi:hypothetical protein
MKSPTALTVMRWYRVIERVAYQDIMELFLCAIGLIIFLVFIAWITTPPPVVIPEGFYPDSTGHPIPIPEGMMLNNESTLIPKPTPIPTPTPVPAPTMSEAQVMAATGGLHMGEWLSWKRENVSGYKDMSTHVTVYGWRMYGTVNWRSYSWGTYFREGAGEQNKWLFVLVNSYSDQNMSRMWGIQPNQFRVQIGQDLYEPSETLRPEIRIKEMDEIWNLQHVENVKPYSYLRRVDKTGEYTEELGYIKAGQSNAWDGYIVFQIPARTKAQDIKVLASFQNLTEPHWWKLE